MKVQLKRPTCPYCHAAIEGAQPKVGCPGCMAWQHSACLLESRSCAACGRAVAGPAASPATGGARGGPIDYRIFRSSWSSWESLFSDAAAFASWAGPEGLVSISHSADENDGVVTVWFRPGVAGSSQRALRFQVVRGALASWDSLFSQAGQRASGQRVAGISHSEDKNEGVIAVWYWAS